MARPRVFVSSTYYDLKHVRSSLENFIESLGFDAILSEKGVVAYSHDVPLDESCYKEVDNADIFVMVIGGRYGSERSATKSEAVRAFYERYDSVTKQEYQTASDRDIPIYILVERPVYADYETYLRNKNNESINYAHVDSANVFRLIEEILAKRKNNPIFQFDKASEIETWLREQWAGYFRELLSRTSSQAQIASLASQVDELKEINRTLKTYLEEIVTTVAPEKSQKLIEDESNRLRTVEELQMLAHTPVVHFLTNGAADMKTVTTIRNVALHAQSLAGFFRGLYDIPDIRPSKVRRLEEYLKTDEAPRKDFAKFRTLIGNPRLRLPRRTRVEDVDLDEVFDDLELEDIDDVLEEVDERDVPEYKSKIKASKNS